MSAAIEARGLAKTYRSDGVEVLALRGDRSRDRTGRVRRGDRSERIRASRRSLHLLGGLERPTAGTVHVGGRRIDELGERALALMRRTQVGFVFQAFNLVPSLSAGRTSRCPSSSPVAVAGRRSSAPRRLLDAVGAGDRARVRRRRTSRVASSSGSRSPGRSRTRRTSCSPTSRPGTSTRASARDVMSLFRAAADRGQAIVVVTHDPRVAATADRVVSLVDGLVVDDTRLGAARPVEPLIDLGRPS